MTGKLLTLDRNLLFHMETIKGDLAEQLMDRSMDQEEMISCKEKCSAQDVEGKKCCKENDILCFILPDAFILSLLVASGT